ncbi:methionyl-tRNA formyltransferase [Fusobacterium sp. HC1336]|uniref:methionyl-tRNA formyltransferase n=1 Tax=Fusobacterium sp. HC1336 TaxID=3171169 RepID=UPI003F29287D
MKKVIFLGFGKLGKDCLDTLLRNDYQIEYVLTHKEERSESVDTYAKNNNLDYSYGDLRKDIELKNKVEQLLKKDKIDYLISINYRYIIPEDIFIKVEFPINIHGSLLPKYRGRTPHVWNIINGEKMTGITCHKIEKVVDTGDIIFQEKIKIDSSWTGNDLLEEMQKRYPEILLKSLQNIEKGEDMIKQDEKKATYYGKRIPEMGYINFNNLYIDIYNFVRAQAYPYPGAYYYLETGKKIIIDKIIQEKKLELETEIGKIVKVDSNYYVKCRDTIVKILEYRYEEKE